MPDMKNAVFFEFEGQSVCGIIRSATAGETDEITETRDENGKTISHQENPVARKIWLETIFRTGTVLPRGSSFSLEYAGRVRRWIVIRTVTTKLNRDFMQAAVWAAADE